MSEFPWSLLEEYEQLVESEKEKSLNTETVNTYVSGAPYQDAIRPSERQQFDSTTANISADGAHQDLALHPQKKRRFQWWQIWEMEECFLENSNPNKKQRKSLSNKISLPALDVQLWFQNRRSQQKIVDDLILEIEKLQVEMERIKQAIRHITCQNCGHGVVLDVTPSFVVSSSLLGSEVNNKGKSRAQKLVLPLCQYNLPPLDYEAKEPQPPGSTGSHWPGSGTGAGSFLEDSRSMEFVDRPRSHCKGDAWARPSDDRRGFQGSREMGFQRSREGGFLGSSSRERW